MIGVVTGICLLNSGHSPADLVDTGDPAEHLRQIVYLAAMSISKATNPLQVFVSPGFFVFNVLVFGHYLSYMLGSKNK